MSKKHAEEKKSKKKRDYYDDVHNNVAYYCNKNIFTFSCKNAISKNIYFLCHVINRTLNSSFYIIEFIFVAK